MSTLSRDPVLLPVEAVAVVLGVVTVVVAGWVGTGAATRVGEAVGAGTNVVCGAADAGTLVTDREWRRLGVGEGSARWVRLGTALGVAPLVALGAGAEVGWAARVGAVVATGRGLVAAGDCGALGVGLAAAAGPAGDSTARPTTQPERASADRRRAQGVGTARRLRSTGVLPGVNR